MATAIVSIMTGIPVRHEVAMTGEIKLRGRVLPIDGSEEKLLAVARGGIRTVLIPEDNAKDLTEISDAIKGGMTVIPVAGSTTSSPRRWCDRPRCRSTLTPPMRWRAA